MADRWEQGMVMHATPAVDTRTDLATRLANELASLDVTWAIRGSMFELGDWAVHGGELDLWAPSTNRREITTAMIRLGFVPTAGVTSWRPHHLRFRSLDADATIEWLFGPLAIGPVELLAERWIETDGGDPSLMVGAACFIDRLPRRLALGKQTDDGERENARHFWSELSANDRQIVEQSLREAFGGRLVRRLIRDLERLEMEDTESLSTDVRAHLRRRLARSQAGRREGWRRLVQRVRRRRKVDGRTIEGLAVALIGTDGTGKSTTVAALREHLDAAGITTHDEYFGRTRGNLPGIAGLRRAIERRDGSTPSHAEPRPTPVRFLGVRRAASIYYALEYAVRYWSRVAPRLARGELVILDRFIYDLTVMPHASPRALPLARRLVPDPHVVLLLDAPPDEIHARKPERTAEEIERRQAHFHEVLSEVRPSVASATVSTSVYAPTDLRDVAAALLASVHRSELSPEVLHRAIVQLLPDARTSRYT